MEIRNRLRKKDIRKITEFSALGMGVRNYTDKPSEIRLYSRYFMYMELCRATRIIGAFENDEPVGLLLADIKGEKKAFRSVFARIIIGVSEFLMRIFFKGGAQSYSDANEDMYKEFVRYKSPDGEIGFLAVKPDEEGKGIGTMLLGKLEDPEKKKLLYLFTDSNCTYQFYDKRGFVLEQKREIELCLHGNKIPLSCFLYSKKI